MQKSLVRCTNPVVNWSSEARTAHIGKSQKIYWSNGPMTHFMLANIKQNINFNSLVYKWKTSGNITDMAI